MCPKKSRIYQEGEVMGSCNITYLREMPSRRYGKFALRYALFKCHCGELFEAHIGSVKSGHTSSCGCVKLKMFITNATIHGLYQSRIYTVWHAIKSRVDLQTKIEYKNYGGRGIMMFPPWKEDFQLFYDYVSALSDYDKKGYTLDRIDNDGNYEPGNLRWTTRHVQGSNQRKQESNTSGYTGVVKSRKKWCSQIFINGKSIHIGMFATPESAAIARNNFIMANKLFEYPIQKVR